MSHLLLISLGPVQDFIAQARRTRDLWFGSHLLGEVSRAAAKALAEGGATLVLPPLGRGDAELEPANGPLRPGASPVMAIANKVLAEVPHGASARALAGAARAAAGQRLRDLASKVKAECRDLIASDAEAAWDEQIETFLEVQAAWAPIPEGAGGYQAARARVEEALAGRKLLRDFRAWTSQRGHVPKSSLDGARETVLREPARDKAGQREFRSPTLERRYRIAPAEQLDAVGLLKRAGGQPGQFVPLANIALASWIDAARNRAPEALARLAAEAHALDLGPINRDFPWVKAYPFDAQIFLEDRIAALFKELGITQDPSEWEARMVRPVVADVPGPSPYVACLVADGDRIGRALDGLPDADAHREFSRRLADFAQEARAVVEEDHKGVLVYAGGDDVLAFVCPSDAISCAEGLRRRFAEAIGSVLSAAPTLSVGVGIGHVLENMGHLLDLGRQAEKLAKRRRDSLAVVIEKRSGGTLEWSRPWDDAPAEQLAEIARCLGGPLSVKKVYEVRRDLDRWPGAGVVEAMDPPQSSAWADILRRDVARTLARAEGDASPAALRPADVGLVLSEAAGYAACRDAVDDWVRRALVARVLGTRPESEVARA